MKTIQNVESGQLKRKSDRFASTLVVSGKWKYVAKKEWKKYIKEMEEKDNAGNSNLD